MGCQVSKQISSKNNSQYNQNSSKSIEKKSSVCSIQHQVNKYNLEGKLEKNIEQKDYAGINFMESKNFQKNQSQKNPDTNTGYQYSSQFQNCSFKSQKLNSDQEYYSSSSFSSFSSFSSSSSSSSYYESEEYDDCQSDSSSSQNYYVHDIKENNDIYIINQTQNINNQIKNHQLNNINAINLQVERERKNKKNAFSVNNF